jgi:hypothetical protein
MEKLIIKNLNETIGKKTCKGNREKWENREIKTKREEKKQKKKEFQRACTNQTNDIETLKDNYIQAQKDLRNEILKWKKVKTEETMNKLIKEGGTKSQMFWKLRRRLTNPNQDLQYDAKKEHGDTIEDPEEAKEYIADYVENLYQARPGTEEYQEWTQKIKDEIQRIEELASTTEPPKEITQDKVKRAIKNLKRNKSTGPDQIPNEVFIEASTDLIREYTKIMNIITKERKIPEQWQKGEIKRLYKGKGTKGKCSNERGITLASNFGKLYERIINNRTLEQVNISDAQAGGKKGRATTDHIMILKEITQIAKNQSKPLYMVFLDVTKAHDKAWLNAIMYVMHKEGLDPSTWGIVKQLNENLTARIQTKHGLTREIKIKDSIRQGGVLAVAQYATLMDDTAKEINKKGKGIIIPTTERKIGCLLWMDDVVLMSTERTEIQEMLNIADDMAKRYHIEYGKEKSKLLIIGEKRKKGKDNGTEQNQPEPITKDKLTLGHMEIERTEKYKYLGEIINDRSTLENQIQEIKKKTEAAYQTILLIAGDQNFRNIEMGTVWKLLETCIIPIITYGAETWNPNKQETKELNRILDQTIKRLLRVPVTTPREALYIETGLMDTETITKQKRVTMKARLNKTANNLLKTTMQNEQKGGWTLITQRIMEELNINENELKGSKGATKNMIKKKTGQHLKQKLEVQGREKSKIKHLLEGIKAWEPGKRKEYMEKMTRTQASLIFQARTRMLNIKDNYRQKYTNDLKCRACGQERETQTHVLNECKTIHKGTRTKVHSEDIFTEDTNELKETANKIKNIVKIITENNQNSGAPHVQEHGLSDLENQEDAPNR